MVMKVPFDPGPVPLCARRESDRHDVSLSVMAAAMTVLVDATFSALLGSVVHTNLVRIVGSTPATLAT